MKGNFLPLAHRAAANTLCDMAHLIIGVLGSVAVLVIALLARLPTYRVAPLFLLPLIWGLFALRHRIHLHPFGYAMGVLAVLLHDLGAFGFYQTSPLPFSFDIAVHFFLAFAAAFVLHRALRRSYRLRPTHVNAMTLLFIMGGGALHEIMEYGSYLLLGEQHGMLKPATSYFFDTQRDLLNNLLGVLLALMLIYASDVLRGRRERESEAISTAAGQFRAG
jgi:uncharacterized membrane protein YjdF